jgi:hypothetical protein
MSNHKYPMTLRECMDAEEAQPDDASFQQLQVELSDALRLVDELKVQANAANARANDPEARLKVAEEAIEEAINWAEQERVKQLPGGWISKASHALAEIRKP